MAGRLENLKYLRNILFRHLGNGKTYFHKKNETFNVIFFLIVVGDMFLPKMEELSWKMVWKLSCAWSCDLKAMNVHTHSPWMFILIVLVVMMETTTHSYFLWIVATKDFTRFILNNRVRCCLTSHAIFWSEPCMVFTTCLT